jgi:N-acetylglucosaminyl-diphospho-decaprenol L-rhamnosyltransferase
MRSTRQIAVFRRQYVRLPAPQQLMRSRGQALNAFQDFTVSVVSHGHGQMLEATLDALTSFASPGPARIIVTLNLAAEPFDHSRYERSPITVIRNETPKGFAANHNAAFGHCKTPWFAVLNPDLRFTQGNPFGSLLAFAAHLRRPGAVAPRIVGPDGAPEDAVRTQLTPWSLIRRSLLNERATVPLPGPVRAPDKFHWLAGMFLLLPATAFRDVGGFDQGFHMYCEDYDLCARLYCAGFTLAVDPNSSVVHDAQRSSHRNGRHLRWHLASLARVWSSGTFWRVLRGGGSVSGLL